MAFAQTSADADDEQDPGAPNPSSYKSHSGGILDMLEELKSKAETELSELRKDESNKAHNYKMLKQSLEDEIAFNTKEKKGQEAFKADQEEAKATATADLETTSKLLAATTENLKTTHGECMKVAADHDASEQSRAEELKVVAEAKKIIQETASGAAEQAGYDFVQLSSMRTTADLKGQEVARFMKKLAREQHSEQLSQLASRISALLQYGRRNGNDPFVKVKGLIEDMIAKLEKEMQEAAEEKAYCDEQMSKTEAKKSELEDDVAKLTSKIDTKTAKSAKLKEEVKELQEQLASMAKEQKEMDAVRKEQNTAYKSAKADFELGLKGVGKALSVLRKYYEGGDALLQEDDEQPAKPVSHSKSSGAGGSIISILEVCESDFAKALSSCENEEADALAAYEERTEEIKISTAMKSKDVKYKTQESKNLDKEVDELSADRESTQGELDAVLEYYAKVKDRCIAKPETYEERAARRKAEIAGLKRAMEILTEETALVQVQSRHRTKMLRETLSA